MKTEMAAIENWNRRTALASGSGDHAELARLAEAASGQEWRVASPPFAAGASYIQTELPCINGLAAWFSVALVPGPSPEETGYSEGALDADANAAFIAAANPATVLAPLAENAALRVRLGGALDGDCKCCVLTRAKCADTVSEIEIGRTEAELAEAVAVIRDVDRAARQAASMNDAGYTVTVERTATHIYGITDTFLSKEAERG